MSESTSGKMTRLSPLILVASVLLLSCCCCTADPGAHPKQPTLPKSSKSSTTLPVPERKSDHVGDAGKDTLKSQASDSGYGASPNDYNQQQQEYQPPPPPPSPAQAYGQQVHVTEQDYSRPADHQQQQPAYEPAQQQTYDQQSQNYGVKGQPSRPQATYSSQQQSYPAAPQQQQAYNQQPAVQQQQSYSTQQQQQVYPSPSYGGQENVYNSHAASQSSYGSGNNAYQGAGSYNSAGNAAAAQSYGTPLESTYEGPSDYANDSEDDAAYDNGDSGYGTSAPDQQQLSPNNNYQSAPPQQQPSSSSGKGQGYQVAAPLAPAPAYPPPQHQTQPPQPYLQPQSPPPYPATAPSYQQTGYGNGVGQEPSAPSKGGYAAPAPSGNSYTPHPAPADSGSASYTGSDSRGPPQQSYPETSYSYGQQQQQQQGSNYNMPLNYGGFRPIQLVAQPVTSAYVQKNTQSKPLVVAIIQKPAAAQQNSYSAPQGDHYNTQLSAYPSQENNQYQPQQIPANSYSGPPLPLNSYAGPAANPASYQSGQGSYSPTSPPNSYPSVSQSHGNPPYPSSSGSSGQYQSPAVAQPQNYQPEGQQYGPAPHGYEYATEQESTDDEYHPASYPSSSYNPAAPGYPEYPKAAAAQPYPNAGFALDYAEGKPYGGRWLQKPYGKRFAKPKNPYAGNADGFDVTIPLKYGPPPPPEEPKSASPASAYLAPYASMPQVSIYPEESSLYPFGAPVQAAPFSTPYSPKSYRNPSLTQSLGSYGVQNHNLRIPTASSYGTLTSDESDLYASSMVASAVPSTKRKKQRTPVDADLAAGLPEEGTSYKLIPSASKLIPNIVKSPFKKIMKAFSKNKLLSWKRKEVKSVTKD